jgi:hypothetical protein
MVSKIGEISDALGLNGPLTNFASQSEMPSASFDFGGCTRLTYFWCLVGQNSSRTFEWSKNPRHMLAAPLYSLNPEFGQYISVLTNSRVNRFANLSPIACVRELGLKINILSQHIYCAVE